MGPLGCRRGVGMRVERKAIEPGCSGPLDCLWSLTHSLLSSGWLPFLWAGRQWSQTDLVDWMVFPVGLSSSLRGWVCREPEELET